MLLAQQNVLIRLLSPRASTFVYFDTTQSPSEQLRKAEDLSCERMHLQNMLSAKEQREARRRRILERGADRLAYISGQVKTLQQAETPAEGDGGGAGFQLTPTEGFDATVTSKLLKDVQSQMEALDLGLAEEEPPRTRSANGATVPGSGWKEAKAVGGVFKEGLEELAPEKGSRNRSRFGAFKLCKGWSQSISVTELARALFAVLVALLVVGQALLPCEHSSHVWMQKGFPGWPLSLIVVTDVTLVLGVMVFGRVKVPEAVEASAPGEDKLARTLNRLGDQLETWMSVLQVVKGITMDCSIYVVVLICAFSLAQYFNVPVCCKATPQFITL